MLWGRLPGDFEDLYASLTYPEARKRSQFAGEAVSTCHAWVVGAPDSSWRAVYAYLKVTGQDEKIKKFKALWGENSVATSHPSRKLVGRSTEPTCWMGISESDWLTVLYGIVSSRRRSRTNRLLIHRVGRVFVTSVVRMTAAITHAQLEGMDGDERHIHIGVSTAPGAYVFAVIP
ncbi:hypothetical protein J3R83DRAFT_3172 [Lanmaoa asiatica]|nr:hypothetical protein J3R83DRAFT_3172 [Lanmaoa asiatica]